MSELKQIPIGFPNLKAVFILSLCFFMLFLAFNSGANSATKALKDNGFDNKQLKNIKNNILAKAKEVLRNGEVDV